MSAEFAALSGARRHRLPGADLPVTAHALPRERLELSDVRLDRLDLKGAAERIRGFLECGAPHQAVTVNLDFVALARRQPEFRRTIDEADLAVADGMPLVWLSRLGPEPLPRRITGADLVAICCRLARQRGQSVFLLGSSPQVGVAAARKLEALHPGLRAEAYSPPYGELSAEENARIVALIREARPAFLFVALGAPRQDLWIREHLDQVGVPLAIGVGCVLDVLAGAVRRAPGFLQQAGLEWAFRLFQEPRRLWRRYLVDDAPAFARLLASALSRRPADSVTVQPVTEPAK